MIRIFTLHLCLLASLVAIGQFQYNFNDLTELSDGKWFGDINHFTLENGQLRLNAEEAGSSSLFHPTHIPDSTEMHLFFKMDFNPSSNNKLRIYLQLDTFDLSLASGYFLEIGENGSEDKLSFIRMIEGDALTLAEGTPGLFGEGPLSFYLKVNKNAQGLWQFFAMNQDSSYFISEFELFDSTIKRHFDQYFGIQCIYTSTRADKFYFDDIYLLEAIPDTIAPDILDVRVLSPNELQIKFDDLLDKNSVLMADNYIIEPGPITSSKVIFNEFKPRELKLNLANELQSNTLYHVKINSIDDINGNKAQNMISPDFYLVEKAGQGDIVINEILFNPFDEGEDFIEIYNRSGKILDLNDLMLANRSKESPFTRLENGPDLFPGAYLAISPDTQSLHDYYSPPFQAQLFQAPLPALNNDDGNVSIYVEVEGIYSLLDSLDYDEQMHFELIRDPEGVSLERINPDIASSDLSNWQSAGSLAGGATPGYQNSQHLALKQDSSQYFFLEKKIFSPDGDGYEDILSIHYQMPDDAFVGSILLFDSHGNFIHNLINNQLLGVQGMIHWNGIDQMGNKSLAGPYIVFCQAFHPDGRVIQKKLVSYLAINF